MAEALFAVLGIEHFIEYEAEWRAIGVQLGLTTDQISELRKESAKFSLKSGVSGEYEESLLEFLNWGIKANELVKDFNRNMKEMAKTYGQLAKASSNLALFTG